MLKTAYESTPKMQAFRTPQESIYFPEPEFLPKPQKVSARSHFYIRSFVDDSVFDTIRSDNNKTTALTENEDRKNEIKDSAKKSRFVFSLSFQSFLNAFDLTPKLFIIIVMVTLLAAGLVGFLSNVSTLPESSASILLKKADKIEQYLKRDEQRELDRR
jgi:hypothetical protein